MPQLYPCIEATVEIDVRQLRHVNGIPTLDHYMVRVWVNHVTVPEDYRREGALVMAIQASIKMGASRNDLLVLVASTPDVNAVQILDRALSAPQPEEAVRYGTVIYTVGFDSDDPHG